MQGPPGRKLGKIGPKPYRFEKTIPKKNTGHKKTGGRQIAFPRHNTLFAESFFT
jgi:hypothetical protein